MPVLYYQADQSSDFDGMPIDTDIMAAIDGFSAMGYELKPYTILNVPGFLYDFKPAEDDVVIGGFAAMKRHFQYLGILLDMVDYPRGINPALAGRLNKQLSLNDAVAMLEVTGKPTFIKPVSTKLSTLPAKVYTLEELKSAMLDVNDGETKVWASYPTYVIHSEYRVFVKANVIEDVRRYAGSFRHYPDINRIEEMVEANKEEAPLSYALDVGIVHADKVGLFPRTILVEVNDFWAIGSYGLNPKVYAEMLAVRYWEILAKLSVTNNSLSS